MSDNMAVPFLDLAAIHSDIEDELMDVFKETLKTNRFIGGPTVEGFEKNFARFCDTEYCIGVNSGTDALRFALLACRIKPGDTVITVPNTFIATTEAISQAGAFIEFVDIDAQTYTLDPEKLEEYLEEKCFFDEKTGEVISRRTGRPVKAIIPVHLYGQMADMDRICGLAAKHNLTVIEDACQAHGAEYFSGSEKRWRRAGSIGKASAFSFYPGKNLGACGEGGAVTTDDEEVAGNIRMLRDHGQSQKYFHDIEGYNGRLDALQAGILRVKLAYLPYWNEKRRMAASYYDILLRDIDGVVTPHEPSWAKSVYHLYVVWVEGRHALQEYLSDKGIDTGLHYPLPLHLQKAYKGLGYMQGDFPVSEKAAKGILSLPMFPGLSKDQQEYVMEKTREWKLSLRQNIYTPSC